MPKFQKCTVGSLVKIPLGDNSHSYGIILPSPEMAFFDINTSDELDPSHIPESPVLFRAWVRKYAITSCRWPKVGKADIPFHLQNTIPRFIQDILNPKCFEISQGGVIRPASREECFSLECAAVWDPYHIEDRLRDHFAGIPNKWFESMKIK